MTAIFLAGLFLLFLGAWGVKVHAVQSAKSLEGDGRDDMLMLAAKATVPPKLIDIVNRYTTMGRARAVRVQDSSLTVIYARENGTKGRVKFDMDTAFDDVHEGDVGVLVIVEQEIHGKQPFYKFVRDAQIPTIDDILELGTGDSLTDRIYQVAVDNELRKPKQLSEAKPEPERKECLGMELS